MVNWLHCLYSSRYHFASEQLQYFPTWNPSLYFFIVMKDYFKKRRNRMMFILFCLKFFHGFLKLSRYSLNFLACFFFFLNYHYDSPCFLALSYFCHSPNFLLLAPVTELLAVPQMTGSLRAHCICKCYFSYSSLLALTTPLCLKTQFSCHLS